MKYSDLMDANLKTGTMRIYISITFAVNFFCLFWGAGGGGGSGDIFNSSNFKIAFVI